MKYDEAIKLKEANKKLVGTIDEKGFIIGDILIVPSDKKKRNVFFRSYLINHDSNMAIFPFKDADVEVWAIDTKHLEDANILFYNKL